MQMPLSGTGGVFNSVTSDVSDSAMTFHASAPIFAYSSTTDNTNGDTHLMMTKEALTAEVVSEADIAAIVLAANQGEVMTNQVGTTKATVGAVQQFAQQMVTEHSAAITEAQTTFAQLGLTPASNSTAAFLN
jgi:predicted outer membrane protein